MALISERNIGFFLPGVNILHSIEKVRGRYLASYLGTLVLVGCAASPDPLPVGVQRGVTVASMPAPQDATAQSSMTPLKNSMLAIPSTPPNNVVVGKVPAPVSTSLERSTDLLYADALTLMKSENPKEAKVRLEQVIQLSPNLPGPHVNLGLLALKDGDLSVAATLLRRALELSPGIATAHNALGVVYRRQGDFKQAEVEYLSALKADPNYALAHLNLGVLYEIYFSNPGAALEHYEKYQALTAGKDATVAKWLTDIQRRVTAEARR